MSELAKFIFAVGPLGLCLGFGELPIMNRKQCIFYCYLLLSEIILCAWFGVYGFTQFCSPLQISPSFAREGFGSLLIVALFNRMSHIHQQKVSLGKAILSSNPASNFFRNRLEKLWISVGWYHDHLILVLLAT